MLALLGTQTFQPKGASDLSLHFVLLRGLGRNAKHWGEFPAMLRQRFQNARVSCFDLPGFGERAQIEAPLTIEANISDLNEQLRAKSLDSGGIVLLGISLGGMVALAWASQNPDIFKHVIVVNSSAAWISPSWQRLKPQALIALLSAACSTSPKQREEIILKLVSNDPQKRIELLQDWTKVAVENPMSLLNTSRQLIAAMRFRRRPTLSEGVAITIMASESDRLCSVQCSRGLAKDLGAPIFVHPTAGHDLSIDDSAWVTAHIEAILKP